MASSRVEEILFQQYEDTDAPPPYRATVSTKTLSDWTTTKDDGRVDLNVDSSLYKTLARCVPAVASVTHEPDPNSTTSSESPRNRRNSTSKIQSLSSSQSAVPTLNIVIQVVGSRGDVQPFIALGTELKKHGHRVRLATHDTFSAFVRASALEFFPIGGDPAELMAYMVKNPGLIPSLKSLKSGDIQKKQKMVAEILKGCWQSCVQADPITGTPFVANAIIANPPSFAHVHCAQALSIPVHLMFTMPWSNTRAFPHPLANVITKNTSIDPEVANYISYSVVEWMTWQGLGNVINEWRGTIDLEPITGSEGPNLPNTPGIPFTYCWSPALVPKPSDWGSHIGMISFSSLVCRKAGLICADVCGFFFRDPPLYTPDSELQKFLDNGSAPIYIGFGSIVLENPDELTRMLLDAVKATGVRAIISKGWGGLGGNGDPQYQDDDILYLGDCPHEWLFQHVAAVVHHGGAGTTACGLLHGRPTFIIPFFGDQPFWGTMVGAAGAGPMPVSHQSLTRECLIEALEFCLTPGALSAAQGLAAQMRAEAGVAAAVQSFYDNLPVKNLHCDILPKEPAVWQYKSSKGVLRLSNLAVRTLVVSAKISPGKLELAKKARLTPILCSERLEVKPIRIEASRYDPLSAAISAAVTMSKVLLYDTMDIVRKPVQAYQQSRSGDDAVVSARSHNVDPSSAQQWSAHDSTGSSEPSATEKREQRSCIGPVAYKSVSSVGRLAGHVTRATYVDMPLAITEGLRSVPLLYGGHVRDYGYVTDWKSGFAKAGKHLAFGIADGLSDLCMEPVRGGRKEGTLGVIKGVGKGLLSVTTKASSAALGIVAYPGQGIYRSVRKANHSATGDSVAQARHRQSEHQFEVLRDPDVTIADAVAAFESFRQ
ncbi:UDP-glucose,sterol transferase [Boeremia exigua]|uniref:UDP-glucose,sterol transferase n=1 Tax=Boeremia exigua TaxID=749465 RepID=UPI001E8E4481|nr:UDP-glucose,sterol transferase [Boeremia exigua]KAH6612397.1 UDP-glucose,sterol transferase [Boeremia exigua]